MLYPSIQELTNDYEINRYMLVIGTAKCARYVTYKQNADEENYEAHRDGEKPFSNDETGEKAVSTAVAKLHSGEFKILK